MIKQTYDMEITRQPPFTEQAYRAINRIGRLDQSAFDMVATAIRMVDLNQ
jgi:hypothetical protein